MVNGGKAELLLVTKLIGYVQPLLRLLVLVVISKRFRKSVMPTSPTGWRDESKDKASSVQARSIHLIAPEPEVDIPCEKVPESQDFQVTVDLDFHSQETGEATCKLDKQSQSSNASSGTERSKRGGFLSPYLRVQPSSPCSTSVYSICAVNGSHHRLRLTSYGSNASNTLAIESTIHSPGIVSPSITINHQNGPPSDRPMESPNGVLSSESFVLPNVPIQVEDEEHCLQPESASSLDADNNSDDSNRKSFKPPLPDLVKLTMETKESLNTGNGSEKETNGQCAYHQRTSSDVSPLRKTGTSRTVRLSHIIRRAAWTDVLSGGSVCSCSGVGTTKDHANKLSKDTMSDSNRQSSDSMSTDSNKNSSSTSYSHMQSNDSRAQSKRQSSDSITFPKRQSNSISYSHRQSVDSRSHFKRQSSDSIELLAYEGQRNTLSSYFDISLSNIVLPGAVATPSPRSNARYKGKRTSDYSVFSISYTLNK